MEVTKLPPTIVSYRWLQLQLTTIGFATLSAVPVRESIVILRVSVEKST